MKSYKAFILAVLCIFSVASSATGVKKKLPWTNEIHPGDKVCVYDISRDDPLVDNHNDSLKYWYRKPTGNQKSRWLLRPMVRKLVLRALWPGVSVNGNPDAQGHFWYSGSFVVISGGYKPSSAKDYIIQRGKNTLFGQMGRSWVVDWAVLHFEKGRFVKKRGVFSCARKYETF